MKQDFYASMFGQPTIPYYWSAHETELATIAGEPLGCWTICGYGRSVRDSRCH